MSQKGHKLLTLNAGEIDFVEEKSLVFPIIPGDDFHTYTLDMAPIEGWCKGPKLGPIEIDYIRVVPSPNVAGGG